jgi:membrane associated rhomboid family serine protease
MATCYRHPSRETGVSCSNCGRPICPDCMTSTQVGMRCPECAKQRTKVMRMRDTTARPRVTFALIAINVAVFLAEGKVTLASGGTGNDIYREGALLGSSELPSFAGQGVAHGQWWRIVTGGFLHENLLHIGFNMYVLYAIGSHVEQYLGRVRFLALYLVAGLAGSAGALVLTPLAVTVGASGAIFGILGAWLIIEWQTTGRLAGNAMTWIVINLVLSFAIANISIGGHIGGLIGGILITLGFANWGRGLSAYGKIGVAGYAALVGVAIASVAIAYFKVRGYA